MGLEFQVWELIKVKAFEQALTHIIRDVLLRGDLHKVNGAACGIEDDAAIVASLKVFFELRAEISG